MKLAIFDSHEFDRISLEKSNAEHGHELVFFKPTLTRDTAELAKGFRAVCVFVHDLLDEPTLQHLKEGGTELIALRCAGFNNVDLKAAKSLGMKIVRVPEYSPYAVAEHAMALLLALNRKIPRAYNRVRDGNFSLDGLVGFDLRGKTVGVVGLGKIGAAFARIARGFGCKLLGYDVRQDETLKRDLELQYVALEQLFAQSDVISLHVPLFPATVHLVNEATLSQMKPGVIIVNTSRGALIHAGDLVDALKAGKIAGAALDVYEEEEDVFFRDLSGTVLQDDTLARLLSFPNVIVTAHQAFLTEEALGNISDATLGNITAFSQGTALKHEL